MFLPGLDLDTINLILSFCSFPALCRLRSTCRTADLLVATEMEFRYSTTLRRVVTYQRRFRDMLNTTGSVVSGSLALAVAAEEPFPPGDLDLYTTPHAVAQVLAYLKAVERFNIFSDGHPHVQNYCGGAGRLIRLQRNTVRIDVIVSLTQSPTLPIAYFWSTPVMLFLGGDGVSIPFPHLLERGLGLVNPGRLPMGHAWLDPLISKYRDRGFKICEKETEWYTGQERIPPCLRTRSATCPVNVRHFGDRLSVHTRMDPIESRLNRPAFRGAPSTHTTVWWRGGTGCGSECNVYGETTFMAWTQKAEMVGL